LNSTTIDDSAVQAENKGSGKKGRERLTEIVKSLLGMSRAPVALFVVAHAGLASIFALGHLPPARIIILGIFASLTGTASLIGLNDLLDVELDQRKLALAPESDQPDIGSTFIHHPIAKGTISYLTGLIWVIALSVASLFLIEAIRPGLWPILIIIAVLVVLYSKLSSITYWKMFTVASAVTLGAVAGWLAVAPGDLSSYAGWSAMLKSGGATLAIFALWSFTWEVGGRNIPNDFNDMEEDKPLGTKTVPSVLGEAAAARIIVINLVIASLLSLLLIISAGFAGIQLALLLSGIIALDFYMLLLPARRLALDARPAISVKLYNRSAFYPLALLLLIILSLPLT